MWLNCGGLQRWIPCPPPFHGHRALFPVLGKVASSTRRVYKEGKETEYSEAKLGAGHYLGNSTCHSFRRYICLLWPEMEVPPDLRATLARGQVFCWNLLQPKRLKSQKSLDLKNWTSAHKRPAIQSLIMIYLKMGQTELAQHWWLLDLPRPLFCDPIRMPSL